MSTKRKISSSSKSPSDSSTRKSKRLITQSVPAAPDSDFTEEPMVAEVSEKGIKQQSRNSVKNPLKRTFYKKPDALIYEGEVELVKGKYEGECLFTSEPILDQEARKKWPHRYQEKKVKKSDTTNQKVTQARKHFTQAKVDGITYNLHDDAYVKAGKDEDNYICKIIEMFKAIDGSLYFNAQWYYRAKDTVIGDCDNLIDAKCIFFSEVKDDNPLDSLLQKIKIIYLPSNVDSDYKTQARENCDYYYEKMYLLPYTSFVNIPQKIEEITESKEEALEMTLMDIYSGCGGMSTGLCLGANHGGVKLVTRWAIDMNPYACESLKLNHPETQVRNESAENLLSLIKEWEKLCESYSLIETDQNDEITKTEDSQESNKNNSRGKVYEVKEILQICYGDPNENKKIGLHFKVRWKGYGPNDDTWEPRESLGNCEEKLREFVTKGYKTKLLPLPGKIDVICGGPPCQGISGFNRFRNAEDPLNDEKNKQLQVFMDIVTYLKPKYVLMENVVDIIKFSNGFLGRYALGRLIGLGYQARIGMMAAGAYGLPQFRMRVFLWGALQSQKLPQYPLPTHNVVVRGVVPCSFESNLVAYEEGYKAELEKELILHDAISDLPPVENNEKRDEISYTEKPKTSFQQFIRLKKEVMSGSVRTNLQTFNKVLYDHRPLEMNADDYYRVTNIPKEKGANFRSLRGVRVNPATKKVEWDPNIERVYLPSGKPLVPDYAMSFKKGLSSKPFCRLWWDEIVPTVTTRAKPHNHAILHPVQNRVLTIRENARLQGFPDYYKLVGPVTERYIQVGNAVAVPVARALGYSLALAFKGVAGHEPVLILPSNFSKLVPDEETS